MCMSAHVVCVTVLELRSVSSSSQFSPLDVSSVLDKHQCFWSMTSVSREQNLLRYPVGRRKQTQEKTLGLHTGHFQVVGLKIVLLKKLSVFSKDAETALFCSQEMHI